jgi:hypothetical protein
MTFMEQLLRSSGRETSGHALTASATGGGRSADAFGTLTMTLDNTDLLPSGVAAVPEPETYSMMLIGIGLVGWQLQRKSRRSRAHRLC